jgi:hypothetical protein
VTATRAANPFSSWLREHCSIAAHALSFCQLFQKYQNQAQEAQALGVQKRIGSRLVAADQFIKKGFFYKCDPKGTRWQKRWFALEPHCLSYSISGSSKKLKGCIDLTRATFSENVHAKPKHRNGFSIETPERTYYFCSQDEQENGKWAEELCRVLTGTCTNALDEYKRLLALTYFREGTESRLLSHNTPTFTALRAKYVPAELFHRDHQALKIYKEWMIIFERKWYPQFHRDCLANPDLLSTQGGPAKPQAMIEDEQARQAVEVVKGHSRGKMSSAQDDDGFFDTVEEVVDEHEIPPELGRRWRRALSNDWSAEWNASRPNLQPRQSLSEYKRSWGAVVVAMVAIGMGVFAALPVAFPAVASASSTVSTASVVAAAMASLFVLIVAVFVLKLPFANAISPQVPRARPSNAKGSSSPPRPLHRKFMSNTELATSEASDGGSLSPLNTRAAASNSSDGRAKGVKGDADTRAGATADTSTLHAGLPDEFDTPKPMSWYEGDGTVFNVRCGPNYAYNKKKEPSMAAVLPTVMVRAYRTKVKRFHICECLDLPTTAELGGTEKGGGEEAKDSIDATAGEGGGMTEDEVEDEDPLPGQTSLGGRQDSTLDDEDDEDDYPQMLVVNFMLPKEFPSIWGTPDGEGWSVVVVFAITQDARQAMRKHADGACTDDDPGWAPLLHDFLGACTDDDLDEAAKKIHDRMKLIVKFANPGAVEMGSIQKSLVKQFNGKPVLTRPQHSFFKGTTDKGVPYFELDLDVHIFNSLARRGFYSMMSSMAKVVLDIGVVLEGKSDDELPENMLGCIRYSMVDLDKQPWLE